MPRLKDGTAVAVADLQNRVGRIVELAKQEGHDQALAEVRNLVGVGFRASDSASRAAPAKRGPGRPRGSRNKPKAIDGAGATRKHDGRKSAWSGLTPEQRLARIDAVRRGRGLPPRSE